MKRFSHVFFTIMLFSLIFIVGLSIFSIKPVYAQTVTPVPTPAADGWVKDPTVTFLGRGAIRSKDFMDWTLTNYKWNYSDAPLMNSWKTIRNLVYTMSILAVLITGFIIVIKGGQDVGVVMFIKEFVIALVLVTFSYAVAHLLFQISDIIQLFFLQTAGTTDGLITSKDIINISFPGKDFIGYRRVGITYTESAFISLLLTQLSTITFYVIGSLLTVRKVILWFFLISSPLYPILLIYKPIKNTGKIWLKEFLRWLLYAPLFAVFLSGMVIIWKSNILVLPFHFGSTAAPYPTAISILIGGPGQTLSITNSLNNGETFSQYVIALLMLWVAILMPFILLQVFLEFLGKYEFGLNPINGFVNNLRSNNNFAFLKKPTSPSPSPLGQRPGGLARVIPKYQTNHNITNIKNQTTENNSQKTSGSNQATNTSFSQTSNFSNHQNTSHQTSNHQTTNHSQQTSTSTIGNHQSSYGTHLIKSFQQAATTQLKPEIMARQTTRLINFSIPNMSDIVKFEASRLNHAQAGTSELQVTEESLKKIANPKTSSSPVEEQQFTMLQEQLNVETAKGDVLAESILSAVTIEKAAQANSGENEPPTELPNVNLPEINQIQTVSFDDYEVVRALWLENYEQIDVPDEHPTRKSWIEDDLKAVSEAIALLSSLDPIKVKEGLAMVSNILPFFLIGGFSQNEVIAYLKAKCTAAKSALTELSKKEEEQETLVKKGGAQKTAEKHLTQEAQITKDEPIKNE